MATAIQDGHHGGRHDGQIVQAETPYPPSRLGFVATQMAIGLAFTLTMSALSTRFLSDPATVSTGRFADALPDMLLATTGPITGFAVPITIVVRGLVRRRLVRPLEGRPVRPRNVVLRMILLAVIVAPLLGVPGAWLLAATAPQGTEFLLFKIAHGGVVALLVIPVVLVAALRDR